MNDPRPACGANAQMPALVPPQPDVGDKRVAALDRLYFHTVAGTNRTRPDTPECRPRVMFAAVADHSAASPDTDPMGPGANTGERIESTASLLAEVRKGDELARERLCALYLPMLMRWAHGRLPGKGRSLAETSDLVQCTLMQALSRVPQFESQHEGAFLAYLRAALMNNIRLELRRSQRHPSIGTASAPELADDSPLASLTGRDALLDYERALGQLAPERREAVILRVEFGFSFEEIALAMERPSADAARMLVGRALAELAGILK